MPLDRKDEYSSVIYLLYEDMDYFSCTHYSMKPQNFKRPINFTRERSSLKVYIEVDPSSTRSWQEQAFLKVRKLYRNNKNGARVRSTPFHDQSGLQMDSHSLSINLEEQNERELEEEK